MLNIAIVFLFLILPIKYGSMIFFLMDGYDFQNEPSNGHVTLHSPRLLPQAKNLTMCQHALVCLIRVDSCTFNCYLNQTLLDICLFWPIDCSQLYLIYDTQCIQKRYVSASEPYLSTYFAYRVHQCSFETGGRDPRSPFHHSWELDCCTPSSSTVYTLFHRLTTCSNLSRHHPLEGTDGDHGNERRKKRGFRRRRLKITDSIIS